MEYLPKRWIGSKVKIATRHAPGQLVAKLQDKPCQTG
ncbi:MAG: DUF2080 family transposase-associated protein [Thermoflexales bacterium]|nr:DUF2080 family transposase-associated protein [Thermoflexales bacterium]